MSSQQCLLPHFCLLPLTPGPQPLSPAVPRPRNAPPLLATLLILPQQGG